MVEARDDQFTCRGLPKAFVSLPMDRPFYWCSACASSVQPPSVLVRFRLYLAQGSAASQECRVIWQRNHEVGVAFLSPN